MEPLWETIDGINFWFLFYYIQVPIPLKLLSNVIQNVNTTEIVPH